LRVVAVSAKPFFIAQRWGRKNPAYAEQFGDPEWELHNGIDPSTAAGGEYGKRWPVYCPVEGFVVESINFVPNGGGHEVSLISKSPLNIFGEECYVRLFFCHRHGQAR